ncbi:MAG: hypothetical protein OXF26_00030 [Alphaproteobacteria bacterium]|nr:hypothetical protein [Alphaproteobacteria bacterium]MCY4319753.1 hypothetical protein [Alphaproteobacteria bacterium]
MTRCPVQMKRLVQTPPVACRAIRLIGFTPEQHSAWERLTGTVRAGSEKIGKTCAETEALQAEKTLPAKLALAATKMASAVSGDIRPALDGWYAEQ